MQVLITIKKDILKKVIIENRTDLVRHLYYIVLDIRERNPSSEKYSRRTRVVNLYNSKIGNGCVWQVYSSIIRRAIQDISWGLIMQEQVLILGDINVYSFMWNLHCRQSIKAGLLEELIESYELIVNNDTEFPIRPSSLGISIIDLALTSPDLSSLYI